MKSDKNNKKNNKLSKDDNLLTELYSIKLNQYKIKDSDIKKLNPEELKEIKNLEDKCYYVTSILLGSLIEENRNKINATIKEYLQNIPEDQEDKKMLIEKNIAIKIVKLLTDNELVINSIIEASCNFLLKQDKSLNKNAKVAEVTNMIKSSIMFDIIKNYSSPDLFNEETTEKDPKNILEGIQKSHQKSQKLNTKSKNESLGDLLQNSSKENEFEVFKNIVTKFQQDTIFQKFVQEYVESNQDLQQKDDHSKMMIFFAILLAAPPILSATAQFVSGQQESQQGGHNQENNRVGKSFFANAQKMTQEEIGKYYNKMGEDSYEDQQEENLSKKPIERQLQTKNDSADNSTKDFVKEFYEELINKGVIGRDVTLEESKHSGGKTTKYFSSKFMIENLVHDSKTAGRDFYYNLYYDLFTEYHNLKHILNHKNYDVASVKDEKVKDAICNIIKLEHELTNHDYYKEVIDPEGKHAKSIEDRAKSIDASNIASAVQSMREELIYYCQFTLNLDQNKQNDKINKIFSKNAKKLKELLEENINSSNKILSDLRVFRGNEYFKTFCPYDKYVDPSMMFTQKALKVFKDIFSAIPNLNPNSYQEIKQHIVLTKNLNKEFNLSDTAQDLFTKDSKGNKIVRKTIDVIDETLHYIAQKFTEAGIPTTFIQDIEEGSKLESNSTHVVTENFFYLADNNKIGGMYHKNHEKIEYNIAWFENDHARESVQGIRQLILHENLHRFLDHLRDYSSESSNYNYQSELQYIKTDSNKASYILKQTNFLKNINVTLAAFLDDKISFDEARDILKLKRPTVPEEYDSTLNSQMSYKFEPKKDQMLLDADVVAIKVLGYLYQQVQEMKSKLLEILEKKDDKNLKTNFSQCIKKEEYYSKPDDNYSKNTLIAVGTFLSSLLVVAGCTFSWLLSKRKNQNQGQQPSSQQKNDNTEPPLTIQPTNNERLEEKDRFNKNNY